MKIAAYSYRDFDEAKYFEKFSARYGVEIIPVREAPGVENAVLAAGCRGVSILTTPVTEEVIRAWKEQGVEHISTRTVGYDHVDVEAVRKYGMALSNVTYSTGSVADYTVMLILMSIRKMKRIMQRAEVNDFSLPGIQGRELPNFTVGVLGTGRIGRAVIRDLSGFGCRIYAYDKYENESVKEHAQYADLDTIFRECDLITLHMPLEEENFHLIDRKALEKMKDGVVIVNTARGGLIDTKALIEGIESGKVGAAGLDVIEDEFGLYYYDLKSDILSKRDLYILRGFPNVVVTPHMAFYTDQAVSDMVKHSIESCLLREAGEEDPWKVL